MPAAATQWVDTQWRATLVGGHGARYGRYYEGGAPIYDSYGGGGYYEGGAPIYDSCGDGSYGPGYGCPGYGVPFVGAVINGIFGGYGPPY